MPKNSAFDFSVVVPAYNEEKFLSSCLEALKNQDFSGKYEIIVVDNNSKDKTAFIAKKFNAKVLKQEKIGVAWARQKGFEAAQGAIIASTDADTIVPANWLTKIDELFQSNNKIIGFSGGMTLFGSRSLKAIIANLFIPLSKFFARIMTKNGFFSGANFAITKKAFLACGGFNTKLKVGEDVDLALRAKRQGKIIFKNSICVQTSARRYEKSNIKDLFRVYLLNFSWFAFFKKPYDPKFWNVREAHNENISALNVKIFSYIFGLILISILLILGLFFIAINPRNAMLGKIYWHKQTKEKIIALTFDDGPNEPYTSQILDILNSNGIKATFFEVGQNAQFYPEITQKLFNSGQVIANHSYSHPYWMMLDNQIKADSEIDQAQTIIDSIIGKIPHLFRPPHGFKSPNLLQVAKKDNLAVIEWSDMTKDYDNIPSEKIAQNILAKAKPGGIIVLHDGAENHHGADRSHTVEALPVIIEKLKSQGYKFVTVPELLGIPAYNN